MVISFQSMQNLDLFISFGSCHKRFAEYKIW